MNNLLSNKKVTSYAGLSFVVLVWGLSGIASKFYLNYYSATFGVAWTSFISAVALLVIFRKKLKNLNANYFKTALILGVFYSTANLSQKIGLQYTTPTMYAFFENLSCVVVPFLVLGHRDFKWQQFKGLLRGVVTVDILLVLVLGGKIDVFVGHVPLEHAHRGVKVLSDRSDLAGSKIHDEGLLVVVVGDGV